MYWKSLVRFNPAVIETVIKHLCCLPFSHENYKGPSKKFGQERLPQKCKLSNALVFFIKFKNHQKLKSKTLTFIHEILLKQYSLVRSVYNDS